MMVMVVVVAAAVVVLVVTYSSVAGDCKDVMMMTSMFQCYIYLFASLAWWYDPWKAYLCRKPQGRVSNTKIDYCLARHLNCQLTKQYIGHRN